jgi:hypothetical protein
VVESILALVYRDSSTGNTIVAMTRRHQCPSVTVLLTGGPADERKREFPPHSRARSREVLARRRSRRALLVPETLPIPRKSAGKRKEPRESSSRGSGVNWSATRFRSRCASSPFETLFIKVLAL